ncbi:hypothetical protein BU26DRAFT_526093 [Trematosphaeria pertusa]|uniref:Uncharacterized protein n=1 Tax=Trematosphaeria pertusa TaxID=390896 RepID=A0A6A6HR47_9PLEO|nr:uncharacterized protein BU26DRAFT_526093 [Trematosphaeria pertusa]KAF2240302.1 hypothetical protein BU26DRAFT_526093 [Trematosphaeria pertusa]
MWSSDLYDNSITKKNKLRCIMQSKGERGHMRQYFRNMSRAMAAMCDVFATVMDKNINPQHKDFDTVVQNGIWYKTEFPQLYLGGLGKRVTQIEAISPDGNTAFTYWTQGGHPQSEKRNEGLTFGSNVSFNHTAFDDEFDADFEFDDAEWDDSWFDEDDFDDDFEEDESLDLRSLDARAAKCPLKPGTTDSRAGSFDIGGSHPIAW